MGLFRTMLDGGGEIKEFPAFDASAAAVADHDEPSGGGA